MIFHGGRGEKIPRLHRSDIISVKYLRRAATPQNTKNMCSYVASVLKNLKPHAAVTSQHGQLSVNIALISLASLFLTVKDLCWGRVVLLFRDLVRRSHILFQAVQLETDAGHRWRHLVGSSVTVCCGIQMRPVLMGPWVSRNCQWLHY